MDIEQVMKRVYETAKKHGWWDVIGKTLIPEKLCLIHSEVSEALEEYRKGTPYLYDGLEEMSVVKKPEGIAAELADVIIRVLDLCAAFDIPIVQALEAKMAYNDTRSYRHGGKKC